ncbi:BTB/POZ domain-containing protein [Colletotrichum camelliae]|nr:BTB/POZ domain-containing protein [Colletotrichum camelliae]
MEVDADGDDANMVRDNAIVNIAANGDVIMVVGPNKKEFRLDSCILTTTPMSFNHLLGPNIVEGCRLIAEGRQLIANEQPVKIDLPEDDVESMDFIFRTIHDPFDVFFDPKDFPFFEILVAAQKYFLVFAIKNAFRTILLAAIAEQDTLKGMSGEKLWKFAMASAFVEDAAAFKAATRALASRVNISTLPNSGTSMSHSLCAYARAMQELLWACKSKPSPIDPKGQFKYTFGTNDPDFFIETCVSSHLDLIEGCVEYQNGDRHTDDEGRYWMDVLKEKAGLDLNRFV